MKRLLMGMVVGVTLLVIFLAACAPPAAPGAAPAPAAGPQTSAPKVAPDLSPEEAAWAKVVEAAKKEGRVTLYTWYFTGERGGALTTAFGNKYGLKLEIITGRGAEFLERLKTEQRLGQMVADVVEGSSLHLENMRLAGVMAATPDLPVLKEKDVWHVVPNFHNKDAYFLNYQRLFLTVYVNTKLVKPGEEPKSFMELLEPKWKGRLLISDPVVSEASSRLVLFIQQKRLPEDYPARLGQQELKFDPSTPGIAIKLARGEAAVAIFISTLETAAMVAEGAPLRILDMKEGTMVDAISMGAIGGGPHPNAAKVFLNYVLSDEGQRLIADKARSFPVRKGIAANVAASLQLEPSNPLLIDPEAVQVVAKVFREKQLVPALKPK